MLLYPVTQKPERGSRMSQDATIAPRMPMYEETVAAGKFWSRRIEAGEVLRIVDLEGQQAVDFLCYCADDLEDRYSATNTIKVQNLARPGAACLRTGSTDGRLLADCEATL